MSSQSFDDGPFILTTSFNPYPSMIGTQTTPTLTPTTLKNITECLAGQENELFHQSEHEFSGGFVPPDINFNASVFRSSSQHSQQQQQQQQSLQSLQSLQGQGQENVCNNFLPSASDNESTQVTDEDDESTSFSTGGYSHCPGDSASNDSQETFSTKSSSLRSGSGTRNNSSITRSSNNNSINNKSGSRAKSRTQVRRTRGARNDEKLPPEEEQRRRLRRERNKQAAARCRKRRLDHTEELTQITDGLEEEQRKLRKVLQDLERQKEELEFHMQQHLNSGDCRKTGVRQEVVMGREVKSGQQSSLGKSRRPSSLPLGPGFPAVSSSSSNNNSNSSPAVTSSSTSLTGGHNTDSLIPIQTPSNGLFDGLCGLTPLLDTPSAGGFMPSGSCAGQTRSQFVSSDSMVTSPDAPMKLVSL